MLYFKYRCRKVQIRKAQHCREAGRGDLAGVPFSCFPPLFLSHLHTPLYAFRSIVFAEMKTRVTSTRSIPDVEKSVKRQYLTRANFCAATTPESETRSETPKKPASIDSYVFSRLGVRKTRYGAAERRQLRKPGFRNRSQRGALSPGDGLSAWRGREATASPRFRMLHHIASTVEHLPSALSARLDKRLTTMQPALTSAGIRTGLSADY